MMPLGLIVEAFLRERLVFFRDNVLDCGTLTTVCLECSQVVASTRAATNHECAEHVRDHHSPPPEPPTADHGGGTPPAGADPSEDTPPSERNGSLGDSGGGKCAHHWWDEGNADCEVCAPFVPDKPIPYRLSDAELENIALRRQLSEALEIAANRKEIARELHKDLTKREREHEQAELASQVLADELEAERQHRNLLERELSEEREDRALLEKQWRERGDRAAKLERELEQVVLGYVRTALACNEYQQAIANHECAPKGGAA